MKHSLFTSFYVVLVLSLAVRLLLAPRDSVNEESGLAEVGKQIRSAVVRVNQIVFTEPTASLVSGVIWGEKESFSPSFKRELARVGLTHVVVASGMNLVMLVNFVEAVLSKRKDTVIILLIVFYIVITGFQPPIIRAALMVGSGILARFLGRPVFWLNPLLLATSLLVLIQPEIVFSLSFQLSFLATLGILVMEKLIAGLTFLKHRAVEPIIQTIAAQIFTLPIVLTTFGNYSLVSLPANALLLWTIPWLMIGGFFAGITGLVNISLGRIFGLPVQGLGHFFQTVVDFFSSQSFALIRINLDGWMFPTGYYSLLFGFVFWLLGRKKEGKSAIV